MTSITRTRYNGINNFIYKVTLVITCKMNILTFELLIQISQPIHVDILTLYIFMQISDYWT